MNENKQKHIADVEKVTLSILKNLNKLGQLGSYNEFTEDQKKQLFDSLKKELDKTKRAFNSTNKTPDEFTFKS